jgi:hypothetical protein
MFLGRNLLEDKTWADITSWRPWKGLTPFVSTVYIIPCYIFSFLYIIPTYTIPSFSIPLSIIPPFIIYPSIIPPPPIIPVSFFLSPILLPLWSLLKYPSFVTPWPNIPSLLLSFLLIIPFYFLQSLSIYISLNCTTLLSLNQLLLSPLYYPTPIYLLTLPTLAPAPFSVPSPSLYF